MLYLRAHVCERPSTLPTCTARFFFEIRHRLVPAHSVDEQVLVLCTSAQRSCTFLLLGKWNYIDWCIGKPMDNSTIDCPVYYQHPRPLWDCHVTSLSRPQLTPS